MRKLIYMLLLLMCLTFACSSCTDVHRYTNHSFFAMNTFITVIGEDNTDFDSIEKLTSEYELLLSRTDTQSEISRLNADGNGIISDDTALLLHKSLEIARATDGAYNPCMGGIVSLWDITSGKEYVPSQDEVSLALALTDFNKLSVNGNNAILDEKGIQVDLGGIAKGFALQKAVDSAKATGVENICISFGGNVGVIGSSGSVRKSDGEGWRVGITNPFDKDKTLGTLLLKEGFISVSGAYERFFEKDGKVYHHIFDPKTGTPSDSDLASACVITDDGALGDALSTALFVMGSKKAAEFYSDGPYEFDMILIKNDGEILVTGGVSELFTLTDSDYSVKYI